MTNESDELDSFLNIEIPVGTKFKVLYDTYICEKQTKKNCENCDFRNLENELCNNFACDEVMREDGTEVIFRKVDE